MRAPARLLVALLSLVPLAVPGRLAAQDSVRAGIARDLDRLAKAESIAGLPSPDSVTLGPRTIPAGSTVRGAVVARGPVVVAGRVEGAVVSLAGDVTVPPGGVVTGDAVAVGGRVIADGEVGGEMRSMSTLPTLFTPAAAAVDSRSPVQRTYDSMKLVAGTFGVLLVIALGVLLFAGPNLDEVVATLERQFGRAFWVGLLGQLLILPVLVVLLVALAVSVIGILLIPFAIVAYAIAVAGLVTLGFLAVARLVGGAVHRPSRERAPVGAARGRRRARRRARGDLGRHDAGARRDAHLARRHASARRSGHPARGARVLADAHPAHGCGGGAAPDRGGGRAVMSRARGALSLAVALALPIDSAAAQNGPLWRTIEVSRQLRDTLPQRIRVQYDAGRLDVRGTADPVLYSMHLRYDETRATPLHRYDLEQRSTVLGVEPIARSVRPSSGGDRREPGELLLTLPNRVPLDLDLELGGTQSTLELGGLSLRTVRIECGATDATLLFTQPNRIRMHQLEIGVGAADFTATHLANSNAEQIRLRGGVGVVDLEFGGVWTHDMTVSAQLAVGKLRVRIPRDVGVRLTVSRVAAGFDHEGLVKRDDGWYSDNYEQAAHKLHIDTQTFVGKIEVQRTLR
jgi:hypothetical protein